MSTAGKGQATRERILRSAVVRFAEDGFRQTSVAQVARDAGVTPPSVHGYFGSKEDLFRAAFTCDAEELLDLIGRRLAEGVSPGAGAALLPALLIEVETHPLVRRVLQGREPDHTMDLLALPAVTRARDRLTELVTAGQAHGLVRTDLPATALAGALETLVLALLLGGVQVGMIGDEHRRAALATIIRTGLMTPLGRTGDPSG